MHLTDCEREGKVQKSTSKLCHEENSAIKGEGERWDDACKSSLNAVFDFKELELIWIGRGQQWAQLWAYCAAGKWFSRFIAGIRTLRIQSAIALLFFSLNCWQLPLSLLVSIKQGLRLVCLRNFSFFLIVFLFCFFLGPFCLGFFLLLWFGFFFRVFCNNVWKLI